MNKKSSSQEWAAQFAAMSTQELVNTFNREAGCRGWTSARAAHDGALIDEMERRGIDLSAIRNGKSTSFAHKIKLDGEKVALDL